MKKKCLIYFLVIIVSQKMHPFIRLPILVLFIYLPNVITTSSTTSPVSFHSHHLAPNNNHETITNEIIKNKTNGTSTILLQQHGSHHGTYKSGQIIAGRGIHLHERNGHFYRGHFENSKYHGIGVLHKGSTTYHGRWFNGSFGGPVTTTLRNGTVWSSHFHDSKPWNGKTRWEWCIDTTAVDCLDHSTYFGKWFRGQPSGDGVFTNGTWRYEGHFLNGMFAGHGTLLVENKYRYDGEFEMGEMHGQGVYWDLKRHSKFWGAFASGRKEGIGYTKTPGFLYGFVIEKNIWRDGIQKMALPHNEL